MFFAGQEIAFETPLAMYQFTGIGPPSLSRSTVAQAAALSLGPVYSPESGARTRVYGNKQRRALPQFPPLKHHGGDGFRYAFLSSIGSRLTWLSNLGLDGVIDNDRSAGCRDRLILFPAAAADADGADD
jgi:hypothetical protein